MAQEDVLTIDQLYNQSKIRPPLGYKFDDGTYWAGDRWGRQTKGSYQKLENQGEFKLGTQLGHNINEAVFSLIPRGLKDTIKKGLYNTQETLSEADLVLKDFSEISAPGSTLKIEQNRKNVSEAVETVTEPFSKASKWFSDTTGLAPWISDELGMALVTFGAGNVYRKGIQLTDKAIDTAKKGSSALNIITEGMEVGAGGHGGGGLLKAISESTRQIEIPKLFVPKKLTPTQALRRPISSSILDLAQREFGFIPLHQMTDATRVRALNAYNKRLDVFNNAITRTSIKPDTLDEMIAIPWNKVPAAVYGKKFSQFPQSLQHKIRTIQKSLLKEGRTDLVHIHHLQPKMVDSEIKQKMYALIQSGAASLDDLRLLEHMKDKLGFGGGGWWLDSKNTSILAIPATEHSAFHSRLRKLNLEFKGKPRDKIRTRLANIDNPDDLIEFALELGTGLKSENLNIINEIYQLERKGR